MAAISNLKQVLPRAGVGVQQELQPCPTCGCQKIVTFLVAPDRFHLRSEMYRLVRCNSCSGVWLDNPPKPEEMPYHYGAEYYKGIAAAGETAASQRWKKQNQVISRYKQGGEILDIGCSSGGFLGTMKGASWKLNGIEIAPAMAERARVNTGGTIFVGDALAAPFRPKSFDVITCFDVLEHVYQPKQLLVKALEWLKPGGIFYTSLPNIDSWEARLFGSYWYGLELPRHLFHFSPKSLSGVMEAVGFVQGSIAMPRTSYLEYSSRYICSEIAGRLGVSSRPLALATRRSLPSRAVRKLLRLSIVAPFAMLASSLGAGASMEAVFVKSASTE
jgi:SAM-dependent methyltransferase